MPIAFWTSLDRDLLYARWSGTVTMAEFRANYHAYLADRHYRAGRPELIDNSRLENFEGGFNAIRNALALVNAAGQGKTVHTRTVAYTPRTSMYGVARMYQQLAELDGGIHVEVHDDEAAALRALKLPYATIAEMLEAEEFLPAEPRPGTASIGVSGSPG